MSKKSPQSQINPIFGKEKSDLAPILKNPKVGGKILNRFPLGLFLVQPIQPSKYEDSLDAGLPFGFIVDLPPMKKVGLPPGEYKLFSHVPFVEKLIPRGFKIVSIKGGARVYDIYLKYRFAPVFFRFLFSDGRAQESGALRLEVPEVGRCVVSFTPVSPIWLPCTKMKGLLYIQGGNDDGKSETAF